jgi:hypothetical protein
MYSPRPQAALYRGMATGSHALILGFTLFLKCQLPRLYFLRFQQRIRGETYVLYVLNAPGPNVLLGM